MQIYNDFSKKQNSGIPPNISIKHEIAQNYHRN